MARSPRRRSRTVSPVSGPRHPVSPPPSPSHSHAGAPTSYFYPGGVDALPPPRLHFLHLGRWCTETCDFYRHRRPREGEVYGHKLFWLHRARPRDKLVFLVLPVEGGVPVMSLWDRCIARLYGVAPRFAIYGRAHHKRPMLGKHTLRRVVKNAASHVGLTSPEVPSDSGSVGTDSGTESDDDEDEDAASSSAVSTAPSRRTTTSAASGRRRRMGVEVLEVPHADITALDYAAAITGTRLAIETRHVRTRWFRSARAAQAAYHCPEAVLDDGEYEPDHAVPMPQAQACPTPPAGPADTHSQCGGPPATPPPPSCRSYDRVPRMDTREARTGRSTPTPSLASMSRGPSEFVLPPALEPREVLNGGAHPPPPRRLTVQEEVQEDEGHGAHHDLPPELNPMKDRAFTLSTSLEADLDELADGPPELAVRPQSVASNTSFGSRVLSPPPTGFVDALDRQHANTMVVVFSQDPHFMAAFKEVVLPDDAEHGPNSYTSSAAEQRRLLALHEVGMPTWAIFFARYGLPYRRWFRITAVAVLNVWPLIALVVGLYDLYKHMPYISTWLAPMFEWMETHFTLRVSVVIAYAITSSLQMLGAAVSLVKSWVAVLGFLLYPVYPLLHAVQLLRTPVSLGVTMLFGFVGPVVALLRAVAITVTSIVAAPLQVIRFAAGFKAAARAGADGVKNVSTFLLWWRWWMQFWTEVARPVKNVLKAFYDGVVHVGTAIVRRDASLRRWYWARYRRAVALLEVLLDAMGEERQAPTWRSFVAVSAFGVILGVTGLFFAGALHIPFLDLLL